MPDRPTRLFEPEFRRYLAGIGLSQVSINGTQTTALYQVYVLTGSTFDVGIAAACVGLFTIAGAPLAGHLVDRLSRLRLLQLSQLIMLGAVAAMATLTALGTVSVWHVWAGMAALGVSATLDAPSRKAILLNVVPRDQLLRAVAVTNPTLQSGKLAGPGLGGVLIAASGPALAYAVFAVLAGALVFIYATLTVPWQRRESSPGLWRGIQEGMRFTREHPIVYHLIGLDVSAQILMAYRVVLPAIALDRLDAGPTGYGLLSAAVPAGGLIGGLVAYLVARHDVRIGRLLLGTAMGYGLSCFALGLSHWLVLTAVACALLGLCDSVGASLRQAAVMMETPDEFQGRVQSLYLVGARGGPALGEFNVGVIAAAFGATAALMVGGLVPIVYAGVIAWRSPIVRNYRYHHGGPRDPERDDGSQAPSKELDA